MLPTLALIKHEKVEDYIVGFAVSALRTLCCWSKILSVPSLSTPPLFCCIGGVNLN